MGTACVARALAGVSPASPDTGTPPNRFGLRATEAIGETPMGATGTVALPIFH